VSGSLTHTVRDLAAQEAAIFSAWFRRDAALADKWLCQIKRPNLVQPLTRKRIQIATHCARCQFEEALVAWNEGVLLIKQLPDTSANKILVEGWQEWRKQIEERQKAYRLVDVNE